MKSASSLAAVLLLVMSGVANAQSVSPATSTEIKLLFTALETSRCEFSRNGTWYDAQKASQHLQQKYDYLLKKNLVTTTESFIERAASQSSVSGKPYQVKCAGEEAVASKAWFTHKLAALRKTQ